MKKIFLFFTIYLLFIICSPNIISADSDVVDCKTLKRLTPKDCPNGFVSITKLVGIFDGIYDKNEFFSGDPKLYIKYNYRYELFFKPDKNQNHDYIHLYKALGEGPRPYILSPKLKNFTAPCGARVMITIKRTQKFKKYTNSICTSCDKTDVVTAIKLL